MNERTIFLQALEKTNPGEREAYVAEACGTDANLRERVEELLQSHTEIGSFLQMPLLEQDANHATPDDATETRTAASESPNDGMPLDFLAPPQRQGSLGRLDHYEVLEVVGRGGMGIVLRAFDEKLHRVVAVKVMARDIAGSAAARKRFSREAKAAAAVVHDHIVPIHAIEEAGQFPYLVMQFIDGKSLQQKIDEEGSLDLKEVLRIGMQIAAGLAAAHKQGLVHRDIKPSNILLENGVQRVKITDFGLARAVDDASVSQSGIVAGTPQYMSPEQADGKPVDHRSDLFSLGSVLYAMCTGRSPFRASGAVATLKRVCEDTPRPIRELNPDIPEWLGEIIAKLHAKNSTERYQAAKEVAVLLEERLAEVQKSGVFTAPGASAARVAGSTPRTPYFESQARIPALVPVTSSAGKPFLLSQRPIRKTLVLLALSAVGAFALLLTLQITTRDGGLPAIFWSFIGVTALVAVLAARLFAYIFKDRHVEYPRARHWVLGALVALGLTSMPALWFGRNLSNFARNQVSLELEPGMGSFGLDGIEVLQDGKLVGTLKSSEDLLLLEPGDYEVRARPSPNCEVVDLHFNYGFLGARGGEWGPAVQPGDLYPFRFQRGWQGRLHVAIDTRRFHGSVTQARTDESQSKFISLFNGKDLTGWKAAPNWSVKDGILQSVGTQKRQKLFTEKRYPADFHLRAEARVNEFGAGSIQFHRPGSPTWITVDISREHLKEGLRIDRTFKLKPPEEWFTLEIRKSGNFYTVRVNGDQTLGGVVGAPADTEWQIALEQPDTHTILEFRKIEIKELPPEPQWVQLFNGKDLIGWKTQPAGVKLWTVEKGILIGQGDTPSFLMTERGDYKNFHFRVEARLNADGDSGQYFRCLPDESLRRRVRFGYEAQLTGAANPRQNGSLYKFVDGRIQDLLLTNQKLVPADTWFVQEVIADGTKIVVNLNDKTIAEWDDSGSPHLSGHLALDVWKPGGKLEIRKIELKELPAATDAGIAGQWQSNWGPVTLQHEPIVGNKKVMVNGSWMQGGGRKGIVAAGSTYDPVTREFNLQWQEPWRMVTGTAKFKLSADGNKLEGSWTNNTTEGGTWTMVRNAAATEVPAHIAAQVPHTPEQVLPALAGTWKGVYTQKIYGSKPAVKRISTVAINDWIVGNQWLRQRVQAENVGVLSITSFEPNSKIYSDWFFDSRGLIFGPSTGRWDAATRTITWTNLPQAGVILLRTLRFVDADTLAGEVLIRDEDGKTVFEMSSEMKRTTDAVTIDESISTGALPPEMLVLDRLVGDWQIDSLNKDVENPAGLKTAWQRTAWKILGGRVVATRQTGGDPRPKEAFTLTTFDSFAKAYRRYIFQLDGNALEYGGGWDEKTQTMRWHWAGKDGSQRSNTWQFHDADRHGFHVLIKDALGKTINEIQATCVRQSEPGWVPLFNGKDLTGWEGDKNIWKWQDGMLVGTAPSGPDVKNIFLWQNRPYRDFELKFQVKLESGNSGVQFRSKTELAEQLMVVSGPQANIVGTFWGSLFDERPNGKWIAQAPTNRQAAVKPKEFNDYYLRCVGSHITTKINGVIVHDDVFAGIPAEGIIGFQIRKEEQRAEAKVTFLDVMIRELPGEAAASSGFVSLFNGKDLTGWEHQNWKVLDGMLVNDGKGYLRHIGPYGNFHCRMEVKSTAKGYAYANFRASPNGTPYVVVSGIPGDHSAVGTLRRAQQSDPKKANLSWPPRELTTADKWFVMDIIVEGSHITIKIDGVVTAEATLDDMGKTGSFDIATFHDGSFLSIRKIEMKELTSTTSPALTELRRVVVVSEGLLRQTRERYAAGAIPVSDVTAAEIDLLEARIPLAEAEQKPGDVWHLLRELVVKREAELEFARKLVEAGRMPTSTVNVADKRVALARARVAQFETKLPDAIRLEGRWTPISAEHAGQPVPVEQIKERICGGLIIRDGRWGSVIGGKQNEGGLHVDAAKLPKQIEFSGSIFEYRIVGRGIYQLDGDNLILCLAEKGQERPNTFTTSPANNFVLIRYRRESPTAKESP